jgi:serine/threonine protein kinase
MTNQNSFSGTDSYAGAPDMETVQMPAPSDPFIGKIIGNCEILEKINEGGTGLIYRAHNTRFDLDRVIKILKPSLVEEVDFFTRFKQEAQLVARFDHPNILRVFDTGLVGGYFYIEMEYITGVSLREYIQTNSRINESEILSFTAQLLSALEYAHNVKIQGPSGEIRGILHRDIKPENIMITPGKLLKLMDFGAAKPLNITSNTMQGMIVGTFHYMSPEQLSGQLLDMRSDFFSMGIVLYEMVTGQRPFIADNLTELIEKIKNCRYTKVHQIRPSTSPLTEELIEKLLQKDPAHRPGSAQEISDILKHCIDSFHTWGTGKKILVPFSIRRYFPTIAIICSVVSFFFSSVALYRSFKSDILVPRFSDSASVPLLENGRDSERKEQWTDAVSSYRMVPPIEKGGLANEYLEAQVRMAAIMIKRQSEFTKARKILEALKKQYSDPSIDAYLGRAYFHLGLFKESQERFENALKSTAGSVITSTNEFKREILYYSACAIDSRYSKEEQNQALLVEAIKAWNFYCEFSKCESRGKETECTYAVKRQNELSKAVHSE